MANASTLRFNPREKMGEEIGGRKEGGEDRKCYASLAGSSPPLSPAYSLSHLHLGKKSPTTTTGGCVASSLAHCRLRYTVTIDLKRLPVTPTGRSFSLLALFFSLSLSPPLSLFDLHCRVCKSPSLSFRSAWDFGATYIFTRDERGCICKEITL